MAINSGTAAQTVVDFQGLDSLRHAATLNSKDQQTLKQVAGQFEALIVTMMLKSMRKAHLAKGIFDSSQSKMYQDMADQQMAMNLSSKGGLGLQNMIIRQLGGSVATTANPTLIQDYQASHIPARAALSKAPATAAAKSSATTLTSNGQTASTSNSPTALSFDSPRDFIEKLWPMAQRAAARIGLKPEVILSQAALETGWGQHIIKQANGQSSHNLFSIKADSSWNGPAAVTTAVEYREGVAVKEQSRFRSYTSYQQSFDDYVDFLQSQPRYRHALQNTGNADAFVDALHRAGYATDPDYANKIKQIMRGQTLAQTAAPLKIS